LESAKKRLSMIKTSDDKALLETLSKRSQKRIPFGSVVERGLVLPGTVLTDYSQRYLAKVKADGTLISEKHKGSIHQVGAAVQGMPACNGWTFWHMNMKGSLVSIDVMRQKVRAELAESLQ
ncbi:MAG: modification methylase, partial [Rhodospirillaceae bacterium]|nr:modification methylase [Rhodospirillaceae bacterium]